MASRGAGGGQVLVVDICGSVGAPRNPHDPSSHLTTCMLGRVPAVRKSQRHVPAVAASTGSRHVRRTHQAWSDCISFCVSVFVSGPYAYFSFVFQIHFESLMHKQNIRIRAHTGNYAYDNTHTHTQKIR